MVVAAAKLHLPLPTVCNGKDGCGPHGTCNGHECVCAPGWRGVACDLLSCSPAAANQTSGGACGPHGVCIDGAAKGQTYEGEWADDAMAGRGAFRYATSAKYEGEFLNNQYQGHGTYTFPSGAVYDGPFVENQMHGEGTYTDEHGVQWKGTFYMGSGPGLPGHASAQAS